MKTKITALLAVLIASACATQPDTPAGRAAIVKKETAKVETTPGATSTAWTLRGYQKAMAERICEVNSTHVYVGRPQALLRSVIVLKYTIDGDGRLTHSEVVRTNHDGVTQATALASIKRTAPFPKPASHLLHNGHVELTETWLFNNDGRFQLRTIAQPQLSE